MAEQRTPTALVVGAGISGLSAAIALTRSGWRVTVQDRGKAVDSRGAALGLWPAAWRGLETIGVAQRLGDTWDYRQASIRSRSGRLIGHLPLRQIERRHGAPVRLVQRPALMEALVAEAHRTGVELQLGNAFADDGRVGAYDVVLGADGINSKVREVVAAARPRPLAATAWRGSCDGLVGNWGEIWGRGMFAGVTPAGRHRTNWYVPIADHRSVDTSEELRVLLRGWPREIQEAVAAAPPEQMLRHPLHDLSPLSSYVSDNVALLGDAAHAMSPSLGQGACQAVLDALAVTRSLAQTDDVPSALVAYDRAQRPPGNQLVRRSRQLLRLQLSPRWAPARDLAMRMLRPISPR